MTPPDTALELVKLIRQSGIFPDDPLAGIGQLPEEPSKAAAVLVRKGVITPFQAKLFLAGKYRGFKLGAYVVRDQIGHGGMGSVYLAEHLELRRKVAIKVLGGGDANHQLAVERFLREARAAAALDHPNIVRIFDVAKQGETHYLVLEYVEGTTLDKFIGTVGPIGCGRAVGYIAQAAAGLQHAHEKGFVHRDIKPGNLIVTPDGKVKILDMGLARSPAADDELTARLDKGAVVGTADYISPEQATGSVDLDIRADIYSLGATFYALAAGRPPFTGTAAQKLLQHQMKMPTPLKELDRTFPPGVSDVVAKMLAKQPADRYQTPAEVVAALAPWLPDGGKSLAPAAEANSVAAEDARTEFDSAHTRRIGPATTRSPSGTHAVLASADGEKPARGAGKALALAAVALLLVGGAVWFTAGGSGTPKGEVARATVPVRVDPPPSEVAAAPPVTPKPPPAPATPPAPAPVKPAPPPPEPPVYAMDTAGLNPGRRTIRDGKPVDPDQPWQLPQMVVAYCWNKESEAEFRVEPTDGGAALGVTNLNDHQSAQYLIHVETQDAPLTADRDYVFRVEYRTTGSAAGWVNAVGVDGEAKAELPETDGKWRTAELPFRRGQMAVKVILANAAVGEGNTFYFRKAEVYKKP